MADQVLQGEFEIDEEGEWRHLAAALVAPEVTTADYRELVSVLRSAQALGLTKETVARSVRSRVPRLADVADFLEQKEYIATWVAALVAVLALILAVVPEQRQPPEQVTITVEGEQPTEEQVRAWIKKAVEEATRAADRAH